MFKKIDSTVLAYVEGLAHFLQRTFGIHPISIYKIAFTVSALSLVISTFVLGSNPSATDVFIACVIFISAFIITTLSDIERKDMDETALKGLSNKRKVSNYCIGFRIFLLANSIVYIIETLYYQSLKQWTDLLFVLAFCVAEYFLACDPLPPGTSKFRMLIERLSKQNAPARSPRN